MNWQIQHISMGTFALDGGAMFGIIPKPLWEKAIPADAKNRITMQTNCLLLQNQERKVIVEVGNGTDFDEKQRQHFALQPTTSWQLALQPFGLHPEQITDVIVTHLHFDHADGLATRKKDGSYQLTFPNAVHHVQKQQLDWAKNPSERDRGSYKSAALHPFLSGEAKTHLLQGAGEICPGLTASLIQGHTPGQQLIHFEHDSQHYVFVADLTPTIAHFHIPWVMAYDLFPLDTIREKKTFFAEAVAKQWALWLYHEPVHYLVRPALVKGRYQVGEILASC